jgi:small-conductance mechanosensitive channel
MDLQKLSDEFASLLSLYGLRIVAALAIFLIGRWLAGMIARAVQRGLALRQIDATISQFISKLAYALVLIFTIVAALSNIGIQTASIIAALGAAGLAIGLALQGSLSNFAVRAWVKTEQFGSTQSDLIEAIKVRFDELGIAISPPPMKIHLHSEPSPSTQEKA